MVVSVADAGGGGVARTPSLAHYPSQYTPQFTGPNKYLPKGDYPPGYDSDSNSDHSSSGRGSGGSDLGSEVDREGYRQDSGRYSADGCEGEQSSITTLNQDLHNTRPTSNIKDKNNHPRESAAHNHSGTQEQKEQIKGHRTVARSVPVTHPPVDAPLCGQCARKDLSFFDPGCSGCSGLLRRSTTTPSHLFAVMRQWVPQVQHNIHQLIGQVLTMGCHVDDRDALTDMTLLHYAVKAGSNGVGDPATALQVVKQLVLDGADVHQRCRWTHMTALHYAAYFDVAPVLDLLLQDPQGVCINDACLEYSGGAPLHIAAANLSLAAVRVLLKHGALITLTDTQGRTPFQCIPTPDQYELVPDVQDVISNLRALLSPTSSHLHSASHTYTHTSSSSNTNTNSSSSSGSQGASGKAVLKAMGLKLGDRVLINGIKTGTLRHGQTFNIRELLQYDFLEIRNTARKIMVSDRVYVDMGMGSGSTRVVTGVVRYTGGVHFASGFWVGVELDVPRGTNDGSVNGSRYFSCKAHHGIFASPSRIIKLSTEQDMEGSQDLPNDSSALSFSRHSLSSSSNNTINMLSSGPLSLGCMAPMSCSSHGPINLGSSGTMAGVGVSSKINLDSNNVTTVNIKDSCSTCSSSRHLLDTQTQGSPKKTQLVKTALYPTNTTMTSLNRSFSARYMTSRQRQEELERAAEDRKKEQTWCNPPLLAATPKLQRKKRENQHWLEVGHNVFYKNEVGELTDAGNKQAKHDESETTVGTLCLWTGFFSQYTGMRKQIYTSVVRREGRRVEEWLGVELRAAKGRHDGMVRGRRYFTCRPRHGIMVKPNKVHARGINGALLVRPQDEFQD
nr:CAP-Gly domain-containing linker protein 4-like [Cherax quadricarinatus]